MGVSGSGENGVKIIREQGAWGQKEINLGSSIQENFGSGEQAVKF